MSAHVLGLDPSLVSTGLAAIHGPGQCTTHRIESHPPKRPKGDRTPVTLRERSARIDAIVAEVTAYLLSHGQDPALVVIEAPSYGSVGAGTWDRAWLWGALADVALAHNVPVAMVPPSVRARWATGSGAGSKSLVGVHMARMWPDLPAGLSDDEWDAVALAAIGAQHLGLIPTVSQQHRDMLARVTWPAQLAASTT